MTLTDIKTEIVAELKAYPLLSAYQIKQIYSLKFVSPQAIELALHELYKERIILEAGNCYYVNPKTPVILSDSEGPNH